MGMGGNEKDRSGGTSWAAKPMIWKARSTMDGGWRKRRRSEGEIPRKAQVVSRSKGELALDRWELRGTRIPVAGDED